MVHEKKTTLLALGFVTALLLLSSGSLSAQQADPPSRVARLNYINGNVSMEPAGVDDWAPAELNRPFTIGDYLYADQGGEAELHLDVAVIRMGSQTSFGFLNLDDRTVQLKLTEGDLFVRIHNFGSDQVFEVDTPNAAVTLLRDGVYRFRVDANGNMSFVVVREGQAEITGGGQSFTLNPDNSATLTGTDQLSYDVELAPQADAFDQWSQERDAHEAQLASARYLPPTVVGYEDLDDYGRWQDSGEYGSVWYPSSVPAGWAPYHVGHWAWIDPWGWTWIDSMPWGFAPFHYGRWVYFGSRWGWAPGPIAVGYRGPLIRPYYAPALVAWFGGAHWGVGISIGGGPSLGWVPLGWGEVFTPAYQCSPRYFNNVNVYNTRIVNNVNITNVYNTVYVNKQVYNRQFVNVRAPNAVMAMSHSAFVSGRPVQQAAVPVRESQLANVRDAAVLAPQVAPTRQSFLATASSHPAVRPPAQVVQRPVVARNTPPPVPASFAARQSQLQRQAGQPFNAQAVHNALPASAAVRPAVASVRPAPAATPVTVRPGERGGGNAAAFTRPAPAENRQAQPGTAARPGVEPARPSNGASGRVDRPAPPASAPPASAPPASAPPASAHGVPPNLRQQPAQGTGQSSGNARYSGPIENGRANQPAPQNGNNGARPQPSYSQPATRTPENRPQPNAGERSTPPPTQRSEPPERAAPSIERSAPPAARPAAPERSAPPAERPAAPERSAPPAERPAAPERSAPPAERPAAPERRAYPQRAPEPPREQQSQPQHESRPSAPSHEDHGKPDHKSK